MANIELRDISNKRESGDPQPADDTIVGAQTLPSNGTPSLRVYESWSWGAIKEWITALVTPLITWANITGSPDDNEDLEAKFTGKQNTLTDVNFGAFANSLTAKTTPLDADLVNIVDTADSNKQKKVTFTNLKAFLKTYFDTLYTGGSGSTNLGYTASPTNGILTSDTGTDATIPLADATNAGLLKPAKYTVLENTTGTNTGDETTATIKTKLGIASGSQDGYLTSGDWTTFNGKQNTLTAVNFGDFSESLTAKTTPVGADTLNISDSADSGNAKKLTFTNLLAYLKSYFDSNIILQYPMFWASTTVNPADNGSYYTALLTVGTLQANQGVYRTYVEQACTAYQCRFYASVGGTLASGETATLYLQKTTTGGVTTEVSMGTITLTAVNNTFYFTGSFAIDATDYVSIRMLTPTWGTNPISCLMSAQLRLLK